MVHINWIRMTSSITHKYDFSGDIKKIIKEYFTHFGVEFYDPSKDQVEYSPRLKGWLKTRPDAYRKDDEIYVILRQFINFHKRMIRPLPRQVGIFIKSKIVRPVCDKRKKDN